MCARDRCAFSHRRDAQPETARLLSEEGSGHVVEADQPLAHDRPVDEGHDPVVSIEPGVRGITCCQALVEGAVISDCVPDLVDRDVNNYFSANRCHVVAPSRLGTPGGVPVYCGKGWLALVPLS
jgi:hypothetical protein